MDPKTQNGTQEEFFKHGEAVRGDISSHDRTVNQEENYFNKESAVLGKPDNYALSKDGTSEQFMNKSAVADQTKQGMVTPVDNRTDSVDYFDKSEAEFGRQSTK